MGNDNRAADNTEEPAKLSQRSGKCSRIEKVKKSVAENLHHVAEAFGENAADAADEEVQSGIARYGKQASEWIDKSANYVEQFDIEQADARVRDLVGRNPGRSILIAGGVGLLIGMVLRRR